MPLKFSLGTLPLSVIILSLTWSSRRAISRRIITPELECPPSPAESEPPSHLHTIVSSYLQQLTRHGRGQLVMDEVSRHPMLELDTYIGMLLVMSMKVTLTMTTSLNVDPPVPRWNNLHKFSLPDILRTSCRNRDDRIIKWWCSFTKRAFWQDVSIGNMIPHTLILFLFYKCDN